MASQRPSQQAYHYVPAVGCETVTAEDLHVTETCPGFEYMTTVERLPRGAPEWPTRDGWTPNVHRAPDGLGPREGCVRAHWMRPRPMVTGHDGLVRPGVESDVTALMPYQRCPIRIGRVGAGTIGMTGGTCAAATAPHSTHVSGGGGFTLIHAPRTPTTLPPQSEHVPTTCVPIARPSYVA